MIYISSSCVRATTIGEAVQRIADLGYTAIELSGGTQPYTDLEHDLIRLQKEYALNYLCHNYFPPPPNPFVVNLASLDDEISGLSVQHLLRGIALSKRLGAKKFGFHAGFLMDIPLNELGKSIARKELFNRESALTKFVDNLTALRSAAGNVELYIENNVVSETNLANYGGTNPLFVTDSEGYNELIARMDIPVLLDVAHLKVSCESLHLDFESQLAYLLSRTDYVHVSDNDGRTDSNSSFENGSALWTSMKKHNLKGKTFTLEVYSGNEELKSSFEALQAIVDV